MVFLLKTPTNIPAHNLTSFIWSHLPCWTYFVHYHSIYESPLFCQGLLVVLSSCFYSSSFLDNICPSFGFDLLSFLYMPVLILQTSLRASFFVWLHDQFHPKGMLSRLHGLMTCQAQFSLREPHPKRFTRNTCWGNFTTQFIDALVVGPIKGMYNSRRIQMIAYTTGG